MPSTLVVEPGDERMHASTARSTRNGRTAHSSPAVVRGAAPVGAAVGTSAVPPPPPTPLWAPQDKRPVWDPGHQQWGIWIGAAWVPV